MAASDAETANGGGRKKRRRGGEQPTEEGLTGTIRMFNADKGWGFIDSDAAGKDIFLHSKHIVGGAPKYWIGHKSCTKDQARAPRSSAAPGAPVRVTFDLSASGNGKPQALNVRIMSNVLVVRDDGPNAPAEGHAAAAPSEPTAEPTSRPDCRSELCGSCGSTIATHLGMTACQVCRLPLGSFPRALALPY
mmetsp:Transcript_76135/g.215309  ORF Transcript_76135/g.215309 Transcript_76135/m.215309 type:complete len:191 (+) Transcript_76135:125-697(+)